MPQRKLLTRGIEMFTTLRCLWTCGIVVVVLVPPIAIWIPLELVCVSLVIRCAAVPMLVALAPATDRIIIGVLLLMMMRLIPIGMSWCCGWKMGLTADSRWWVD